MKKKVLKKKTLILFATLILVLIILSNYNYQPKKTIQDSLAQDKFQIQQKTYDVLDGADALVIFTEWQEFRTPDFDVIANKLNKAVIFDGRNLYDPKYVRKQGIEYHSIGRV